MVKINEFETKIIRYGGFLGILSGAVFASAIVGGIIGLISGGILGLLMFIWKDENIEMVDIIGAIGFILGGAIAAAFPAVIAGAISGTIGGLYRAAIGGGIGGGIGSLIFSVINEKFE